MGFLFSCEQHSSIENYHNTGCPNKFGRSFKLFWILILFWILFHFLILIHLRNVTHLCNSIHLCNLINLLIHNFRFTLIQTCWDTLYYRGENRNTKCTFCNFALLYSMYCSAITYSSSTQCNVHL